jgi:hypothetical protein
LFYITGCSDCAVYAVDERKLGFMARSIKRVNARIEKDEAREPGDKFMAFAKALKLSFAVVRVDERRRDPDWRFMSIEEGRSCYRNMIENAVAEAQAESEVMVDQSHGRSSTR